MALHGGACACLMPLGFYAVVTDGRIDDPNAGWKGRGLWAANGDSAVPWLIEGGKGTIAARGALSSCGRIRSRSGAARTELRLALFPAGIHELLAS